MKLRKNLSLCQEEINEIMGTFSEHFEYSMNDINSYEELTPKEKEIIPKWLFDKILEKNV